MSFYYSMTLTLFDATFIGLDNYKTFLEDPTQASIRNTIILCHTTSGFKVIVGLPLATLLTSRSNSQASSRSVIYFPVLISTVAVGISILLP